MLEKRIHAQRQVILEVAKAEMGKRNELIQEAKAKRKAEHDEIVRCLRSAMSSMKTQLECEV